MIGPMAGMFPDGWSHVRIPARPGTRPASKEVLTSTDIGLPLGPAGTAALLPAAIEAFSEGLEQPHREVLVFIAAARPPTSGSTTTCRGCGSDCSRPSRTTRAGSRWTSPRSRRRRRDSTRRRSPIRRSSRRSCSRALSSRRPRRAEAGPRTPRKPCWRSSRAGWRSSSPRRSANAARCRRAHRDRCAAAARPVDPRADLRDARRPGTAPPQGP